MVDFLLFIATFQPPDFTADMYDTIREDDLDFEDIEWQKWLQGLINSGTLQGRTGYLYFSLVPPQGGGVDPRKLGCDVCSTLSKILHPI